MFAHELALHLKMPVARLLDEIDIIEFRNWQLFFQVRPTTDEERQTAFLAWAQLHAWGAKVRLNALLPQRGLPKKFGKPKRRMTSAEVEATMAMIRAPSP